MSILECININKDFGRVIGVKNISFKLTKGKVVGLLGKNNSGKTTIFRLINQLIPLDSGEILLDGKKLDIEAKNRISYLPQVNFLDDRLTVEDLIELYKYFFKNFDEEKNKKLLKKFKIDLKTKIYKLDNKTQDRLQLIFIISRNVDLYILDEPVKSEDIKERKEILDIVFSNIDKESTILISSNTLDDIYKYLDQIIYLDKGKIIINKEIKDLNNKDKDEIIERLGETSCDKETI